MTTVSGNPFKACNRQEEHDTNASLENCLLSIKKWMDEARLKMNPAKTEFIYFRNTKQIQKCTITSINVAGDLALRSDTIKYLGVWLDSELSFKMHVTKKCKAAMLNFIRIRSISSSTVPGYHCQLTTKSVHLTSGLL